MKWCNMLRAVSVLSACQPAALLRGPAGSGPLPGTPGRQAAAGQCPLPKALLPPLLCALGAASGLGEAGPLTLTTDLCGPRMTAQTRGHMLWGPRGHNGDQATPGTLADPSPGPRLQSLQTLFRQLEATGSRAALGLAGVRASAVPGVWPLLSRPQLVPAAWTPCPRP